MIRVRFGTGLVVQYNDANFGASDGNGVVLHDSKDKHCTFARVTPSGVIVEYRPPCRVYRENGPDAVEQVDTVDKLRAALQRTRAQNRELRKRTGRA